jgi:hypothetical protein
MNVQFKVIMFSITVLLVLGIFMPSSAAGDADVIPQNQYSIRDSALESYAYHWGIIAYVWGWPAVNLHNRRESERPNTEPGLDGGVVPSAPLNQICVLTDYLAPDQCVIVSPNQDTVYGSGYADLSVEPVVFQLPDFGKRYWILHLMDAYTNVFATIGSRIASKPGFYMLVGPGWKGKIPAGINEVFHSPTNLVWYIPRVFINDTPEDHAAIQPLLTKIDAYPLSMYDGRMKTKDWAKVAHFPVDESDTTGEIRWVRDENYWQDFAAVLAENTPPSGEESLFANFKRLLEQSKTNPVIKRGLDRAVADGSKIVAAGFPYSNQADQFGNYWAGDLKGGEFGDDYIRRAWIAKAYIAVNKPEDAFYVGTDYDGEGNHLDGRYDYTLTFAKGELPPAQAFWSLSAYNEHHFFTPNAINRYSVGTKGIDRMKFNADGSLTIYLQNANPGEDKENNWLPVPKDAPFSLLLRFYNPEQSVLNKQYKPPAVEKATRD